MAFLVALGFGVLAPAIPLFAWEFGVSAAAASAVISAFAGARMLAAPFSGPLVNRHGERAMLASGIAVVGISSLIAGFSQSYWQLLLLRGVGGLGSVMFSVSASGLLIRVTPDHLRGRAQGLFGGGFLLGGIAGPALGTVATFSLRAPFFLYAATLAVAGIVGFATLRSSSLSTSRSEDGPVLSLRAALGDRAYRTVLVCNLAESWSVIGTRSALVPLFVTDRLNLHAIWTYVAFFVVSIVSGLLLIPVGRYSDRRGRRPVLTVGLALACLGYLLLELLPGLGGLLAAMVLLGVAGAALSVATGAMLGDIVSGRGGSVVATYQMAGDVGSFCGPLVAGVIVDGRGYGPAFLLAAALAAAPLPFVAVSRETRRT